MKRRLVGYRRIAHDLKISKNTVTAIEKRHRNVHSASKERPEGEGQTPKV